MAVESLLSLLMLLSSIENERAQYAYANQFIAEFYWKNGTRPRKEEFAGFEFTYSQWAASGVYDIDAGVTKKRRFNDSTVDALRKVFAIVQIAVLPEGKSEEDRASILRTLELDIERASRRLE